MRRCPKCRGFYDDELLRFCLKDGVPLVAVNAEDDLWFKGSTFILESNRLAQREITRRRIQKVITMLVTTVLTIMVFYVIAMNAWIYAGNAEKYLSDNLTKDMAVDPSPIDSPSVMPSPTQSEAERPISSPIPTPTRISTSTPTPTPSLCTLEKRRELEGRIVAEKKGTWREEFVRGKSQYLEARKPDLLRECAAETKNAQVCKAFASGINAVPGETSVSKPLVKAANDCKSVTATVTFQWTVTMQHARPKSIEQTKEFTYPVR